MFSRFRKPVTIAMFAKTALVTLLCFAGSYYTWKRSKYFVDDTYPSTLIAHYMDSRSVTFGYSSDKEIVNRIFPATDIREIVTEFDSTDILIETSSTDNVEVVWRANPSQQKPEDLQFHLEKGVLSLKLRDPKMNYHYTLGSSATPMGLSIRIPLSLVFKPGMTKGIDPKKFVMAPDMTGQVSLSHKSISGSLTVESTALKSINAETISGDITIQHSVIHSVNLKAVSANVTIKGQSEGLTKIETVDGDVNLDIISAHPTYELKTISGDIKMALNKSQSLKLNFKSHSGDAIWNKEDSVTGSLTRVFGSGTDSANIETVSGDLQVTTEK